MIGDDGSIVCLNKRCPHYNEEYRKALDELIEMNPEAWMTRGELTTVRGNEIFFIGIIDKGHYYVLFVPEKRTYVWDRCNPRKHLKYQQFVTIENVWPWPPFSQKKLDKLIELNAPQVLIQREIKKRDGPMEGMKGGWRINREAKTLTIRKDNVKSVNLY
jgi:hypothetical protein